MALTKWGLSGWSLFRAAWPHTRLQVASIDEFSGLGEQFGRYREEFSVIRTYRYLDEVLQYRRTGKL